MTQSDSGDINARDIHARDLITGIQQNLYAIFTTPFTPPANLTQLRRDYLAHLRESFRYLDMKGIMQVQQVTQQLPLTAVYVPLRAQSGTAESPLRVAGRMLAGVELPADLTPARHSEPRFIEETLKTAPAVVVLGDPGAGKSTLLKVLALALAETAEDGGPLPILFPLNAYARRLQRGDINLCQYLGDYYAGRQQKLAHIGALFQHALDKGQAVVLLDGLDEVQRNRQHVVRLVQSFVAEYMPHPAAPATDAVPAGNRVVVTSRIVGYEDAPLAGTRVSIRH